VNECDTMNWSGEGTTRSKTQKECKRNVSRVRQAGLRRDLVERSEFHSEPMSTKEEVSDGTSVDQESKPPPTVVERFHARRFKDTEIVSAEKHAIHKIDVSETIKKQKTSVNECVKGAQHDFLVRNYVGAGSHSKGGNPDGLVCREDDTPFG
jgi:hypothetical protein